MKQAKQRLIEEQTSPLFRIMSVYDDTDPKRRQFSGNISAFHIGNGFILSVAHYLHVTDLVRSAPDNFFQHAIALKLIASDAKQLLKHYPLDATTQKRYLEVKDEKNARALVSKLKQAKCDTRFQTLYSQGVCNPFLIIQFKDNSFFNDAKLTAQFNPAYVLYEPGLNRYTFLLRLEVLKEFTEHDIAAYRLINVSKDIIAALPYIQADYNFYDDDSTSLYCLQSSPSNSNLGRLLNRAKIEGILDHWAQQRDEISGGYIVEGLRYLVHGYFRFGSSGAPYVRYDDAAQQFKAIAIQSEAAPIQLTIKNDQEGNFQYVNALASPLSLVSVGLPNVMTSLGGKSQGKGT